MYVILTFNDITKQKTLIERWEMDDSPFEIIEDIEKFNPYHDERGRFASAEGAASFTYRTKDPKKQYLADRAVQRETATSSGSVPPKPDREQNKHPDGSNHGYTSIVHDCGMTRTDAQMAFQAVRQFTGSHYKDIRHAQRGELVEGDEFLTGMNKRRAKVIENFIDKSPQWRGGTIHRGVKVKDAEFERIQPGAKLNMKGIASWSTDENQAISFAHKSNYTTKAVVFHVDNPGKATSVAHLSKYAEEKEVITSYANNYRVVRTSTHGGVKHAYLKWDSYNEGRIAKSLNDMDVEEEIEQVVKSWDEIEKKNPYHDRLGRFTTAPGGSNPMIRTAPPPKNTKIAYKVFVARDGKLYPPMVANPDGRETPVGVWLDASEGKKALDKDGKPVKNTLGREKVKAGGKGTQGGSGQLAYRPGWHLGEVPEAKQFYTKDKETGEKKQKKNFVWAECEIAADHDYQDEAMSYGYNKNGKFQHSLAGLPKIPTDGYYTYRTNPDPTTKPWFITGAMKVNRILTDAETNEILRSHGIEPMKRDGGELDLKALGFNEIDFTKSAKKTEFDIAKADEDKRLVFGWANIAITADGEQIEDLQKDIIDPEDLEEAVYKYVLNFRDAGEEHIPTMRKKGSLVESVMFTKEKMKAMGIPEGIVPEGWWIGFYVKDDEAWQRIKDGTYRMFSIEGKAIRKEVDAIEKANPYHDKLGRFTTKNGGGASIEDFHSKWKTARMHGIDTEKSNKELYEAQKEFYGQFQKGTANQNNFMSDTMAEFKEVGRPRRKPDYTSRTRDGKVSSEYWYTENGVIRGSDHWGCGVASCDWPLVKKDGYTSYGKDYEPAGTGKKYGKASWEDFMYKTKTVTIDGVEHMTSFETSAGKVGTSGGHVINGKLYEYARLDRKWVETPMEKSVAKSFLDVIAKFNPYHDRLGRFSTANGSSSMTLTTKDPKKQHMADMAIARAKERHAKIMPTVVQEKELLKIANKTRNLKNEQLRVVDRDGNVVMERKGDKTSVGFTVGEARENFAGNITIHNHPDGGTFSGADLKNLGYGASEIRVAAPEGDYIMRNTARGAKPTTGGWLSLQEKLDSSVESFKTERQIRHDVGQKYKAEYQEKVEIHAKRWVEAKDRGASQEELQGHMEAYNKANAEWQSTMKPKIEADVRKGYVDQYHDFYKKNAKDYELEYEFIPRSVKKGYTMEDIEKSSGGEVVLDADFNEKIRRITDEIIKEITGGKNE